MRHILIVAASTMLLSMHSMPVAVAEILRDGPALVEQGRAEMVRTLAMGPAPEDWDAAVHISADTVGQLLGTLSGTRILVPTRKGFPAAQIDVTSFELAWQTGALEAHLEMSVTIEGLGGGIPIPAVALFAVTGFESDPVDPDTIDMVVRPSIVSIGPQDLVGALATQGVRTLVGLGVNADIENALTTRVPLPARVSLSTALDDVMHAPVGNGTVVDFAIKSTGGELSSNLAFRALITEHGIWALGRAADAIEPAAEVTDLNAALAPFAGHDTGIAAFVGASAVERLAGQFNAIPAASRAIDVQSTAASGSLFEDRWRDDLLGDGGVFVSLTDPQAAHASVAVGDLATSWDAETSTLGATLPIAVRADAHVKVHVDPLIGGGASTTARLVADTGATLSGRASFQHLGANGQDGIWLMPDLACQNVPIEVATDGELKLEGIGIPVPSIGARFHTAIGKTAMRPLPIVTTVPYRATLPGLASAGAPDAARVIYPAGATQLELHFADLAVTGVADGAWLGASGTFALLPADAPPVEMTPAALADAVKANLEATRPACATDSSIEMLVGGIEIGPNNTAMMLFREAGRAVEDTVKAADKARKDAEAAAERAARDAAAAAQKAADDAAAAAKKAADDAAAEAERLRKEAEKLIPHVDIHIHF